MKVRNCYKLEERKDILQKQRLKSSSAQKRHRHHRLSKVWEIVLRKSCAYLASEKPLTGPRQPKIATKAQPKPATLTKNGGGRGRGRRSVRGRGIGRGKPKSVEELDAEMQDYYDTGANGTTGEGDAAMETNGGGAVQQPAAAGGDTGMDDEILVNDSLYKHLSLHVTNIMQ